MCVKCTNHGFGVGDHFLWVEQGVCGRKICVWHGVWNYARMCVKCTNHGYRVGGSFLMGGARYVWAQEVCMAWSVELCTYVCEMHKPWVSCGLSVG